MDRAENLVIMFTDIVGFTKLTASQSRAQNKKMLRENEKILSGAAKKYGGKRIKSIGDALLFVFRSPTDAVLCSMAMHDSLWEYNQSFKDETLQIRIRVAINSGEVRLDGGDVFGEPVNIAARLEGLTPANEIYFTESIYLSMNKAEVSHELVDRLELKGIPEKVTVYKVPRGASSQRLVSYTDDDGEEVKYPYGGAHLVDRQESNGFSALAMSTGMSFKKLAVGATLSVVMAVGGIIMWSGAEKVDAIAISEKVPVIQTEVVEAEVIPPVVVEPKISAKELNALLDAGNLIGLEARANEILSKKPNNPLALLMQGHIKMERYEHRQALKVYAIAIRGNKRLARDKRYANNIVQRLVYDAPEVTELAKLSPSKPVIAELVKRTLVEGNQLLRNTAADVLRKIKQPKKVDSVAMALLDLNESKSCKDKNKAIQILEEYPDTRALPALEKITKSSVIQRFKVGCLVKNAKKAVKAIEQKTTI